MRLAETAQEYQPPELTCWCCGRSFAPAGLVRLGAHPEVGVCSGCARLLWRRAAERDANLRGSWSRRPRAALRCVRERVIRRGWHEKPVLGRVLRRIDRLLP